jgi:hypothetical protein
VVLRESNSPERVGRCNVVPSAHFFGNMKNNVKGKKKGICFSAKPTQLYAKANRITQSNTKLPMTSNSELY